MTFKQFWRAERKRLIQLGVTQHHILSMLALSHQIAWVRGGQESLREQAERIDASVN